MDFRQTPKITFSGSASTDDKKLFVSAGLRNLRDMVSSMEFNSLPQLTVKKEIVPGFIVVTSSVFGQQSLHIHLDSDAAEQVIFREGNNIRIEFTQALEFFSIPSVNLVYGQSMVIGVRNIANCPSLAILHPGYKGRDSKNPIVIDVDTSNIQITPAIPDTGLGGFYYTITALGAGTYTLTAGQDGTNWIKTPSEEFRYLPAPQLYSNLLTVDKAQNSIVVDLDVWPTGVDTPLFAGVDHNTIGNLLVGTAGTLIGHSTVGQPVTYYSSNPAIASIDVNGTILINARGLLNSSVHFEIRCAESANYLGATVVGEEHVLGKISFVLSSADVIFDLQELNDTITYGVPLGPYCWSIIPGSPSHSNPAVGWEVDPAIGSYLETNADGTAHAYSITALFYPYDTINYASPMEFEKWLTVNKNIPGIVWDTNVTFTYGMPWSTLLTALAYNSNHASDVNWLVEGTFEYEISGHSDPAWNGVISNAALVPPADSGLYVSASFSPSGLLAHNYDVEATGAYDHGFEIAKAVLTVTINDASKDYKADNPTFTATVTGFVNGETLDTAGIDGAFKIATVAVATSDAGTYAITGEIDTTVVSNYTFTFVDGLLTVNKINQDVLLMSYPVSIPMGSSGFIAVTGGSGTGSIIFVSMNESVATVDTNGIITPVAVGTFRIVIQKHGDTNYNVATTTTVDVYITAAAGQADQAPFYAYINSMSNPITLPIGQTAQASYTGGAGSGSCHFFSSDTSIVTVNENTGVVTAVGLGIAHINVTKYGDATYKPAYASTANITVQVSAGVLQGTWRYQTSYYDGSANGYVTYMHTLVFGSDATSGTCTESLYTSNYYPEYNPTVNPAYTYNSGTRVVSVAASSYSAGGYTYPIDALTLTISANGLYMTDQYGTVYPKQ